MTKIAQTIEFLRKPLLRLSGVAILSFFLIPSVFASTSGKSDTTTEASSTNNFHLRTKLGLQSGLYKINRERRLVTLLHSVHPNYAITDSTTVSANASWSKPLDRYEEVVLGDVTLAVTRKMGAVANWGSWSLGAGIDLPTSKQSRKGDSLRVGTFIEPAIQAEGAAIGLDSWDASYAISVARNFHQYKTAFNGEPLTRVRLAQTLAIGWRPWQKLRLVLSGSTAKIFTYKDSRAHRFYLSQAATYTFNSSWSATAYHTNSGDTVAANGQSSNVALIDSNSSRVGASLNYNFL